ncbi:MAG TPA: histidine phosphatase family protein [Ktedonobacteraceae bacterium]
MSTQNSNTFYLVRHGENPANLTKEFSYKLVDYPLTAKGVLQAEQTAAFFQSSLPPLTVAYASPLRRARETGEIIAHAQQLPVTVLEEFREINVGEMEQRPPTEENWREHDQIIGQWFKGQPAISFPGGENFLQLLERARRGLLEAAHGRDRKHILIAAHGGVLAALVYAFCPREHHLITHIIDNCAITQIKLETSSDAIIDGTLLSWASVAHLSGQAAQLVSPLLEYDRT